MNASLSTASGMSIDSGEGGGGVVSIMDQKHSHF